MGSKQDCPRAGKGPRKRRTRPGIEPLESRRYLSSVGWDGIGQGGAELTYYVGSAPAGLTDAEVELAIETALDAWSDVIDVTFTETSIANQRDSIDFRFDRIDGSYGTLAQAWFPDDVNPARIAGDVLFDSSESWELGNSQGTAAFDLTLVAAHEIGHSLGIEHLESDTAVLHDSVSPRQSFAGLSADDIDAALALYAPAQLAVPLPDPLPPPGSGSAPELEPDVGAANDAADEQEPTPQANHDLPPAQIPTTQRRLPRRSFRWHFGWNRRGPSIEIETSTRDTMDVDPPRRFVMIHLHGMGRFRFRIT